jgi:hypothetical protein
MQTAKVSPETHLKMTANRRLILNVLSDHIDSDPPPHSASSIMYALENGVKYGWIEGLQRVPRKEQFIGRYVTYWRLV